MPLRTRGLSRDELVTANRRVATSDTLRYSWRLRRVLRRRRPDVVHTNSMKAHVYGAVASIGARWALVMHVRDRWAPPYLSHRTSRALHLLARYGPDAVVANSKSTADAIKVTSHVVASPLETEFFEVAPVVSTNVLRLAVIGRLAPWKGQDLAVTAVAALPEGLAWKLSIVGDALFGEEPYRDELVKLINELHLSDRVSLLGHVEDVAKLLVDVDVCLLTSREPEPFGNVVTEAMAAGRVVIVPDQGGVTEYVVENGDNGCGYFYEMGSADSLAAAIALVAQWPERRARVGENARVVARRFGVDQLAPVMEDLYDTLVAPN